MPDVNPAERILGVEGGGTKTAWVLVERDGNELQSRGLYLDVPAWQYHVFEIKVV